MLTATSEFKHQLKLHWSGFFSSPLALYEAEESLLWFVRQYLY